MIISIFFIIGVLLLQFVPVEMVALTPGHGIISFIQLFTHMFAHANWPHLLGNYIFVFPYALYVEWRVGKAKFMKKWLYCGLIAAAAQLLFARLTADPAMGLVGSSGAAFGIVAAALWLQDHDLITKIAARCMLAYHVGMQCMYMYMVVTQPFFGMMMHIAFAAHLGGILCGIYLAQRQLNEERDGRNKRGPGIDKVSGGVSA